MKYKYKINGEETLVYIYRMDGTEYIIYIDTEDLHKLENVTSMYLIQQAGGNYRVAIRVGSGNKKRTYLHRLIINAPDTYIVDHIDCNPLNNRKINLRLVDMSGNMQNRRGATKKSKSGIRGVFWDSARQKWCATVNVNNKKVFFRRFDSKEEAIEAAEKARAMYQPLSKEAREAT